MDDSKIELVNILKINIQGNEFEIQFPNIGQLIDIETRKALISSGQYNNLKKSDSFILPYIDILATFIILIPDLVTLLRVESLFDLNLKELKELKNIYEKQYKPWYDAWDKELNK
jgi:hypothetical protein